PPSQQQTQCPKKTAAPEGAVAKTQTTASGAAPATGQTTRQPVNNMRTGSLPNKKKEQTRATPQQYHYPPRVEQKRGWYNTPPRWSRHKRHLVKGEPVEPTLKKLR